MAITLGDAILYLKANPDALNRELDKSGTKAKSWAGELGGVLKNAISVALGGLIETGFRKVTEGIVSIGKQALDVGMDYQSSLNMFQAVSGATGDQMLRVAKLAKELGADMSLPATSAGNAAEAMTELAKAGLSVEDVLAAAKGTLQLAAAGNLSEARSAEIAANALNSFKLKGSDANRVANLLAAAANASSGEVTDMADSLQMVSAVAAASGIPIQNVVAMISEMANSGIQGSDAGTSLKQMFLSLQAPTKAASNTLNDLGIKVYDSSGNMRDMAVLIAEFSNKLGGLTQEQRSTALATIFGSDAIRAANIVLAGGVDSYNKMLTAVTEAGAASELAGARMKGLKGALEGLKSQWETSLLTLAEPLLEPLDRAVRALADKAPTLLDPVLKGIGEGLGGFVTRLTAAFEKGGLDGLWQQIQSEVQTGWDTIIWPKLKEWGGKFWEWVTGKEGAQTQVPSTMNRLIETLKKWAEDPTTQAQLAAFGERAGRGLVTGAQVVLTNAATWAPIWSELAISLGESLAPAALEAGGAFGAYFIKSVYESVGLGSQFKGGLQALMNFKHLIEGNQAPGRAGGGSVFGGIPSLVGEGGPELFWPGQNGTITPNNSLAELIGTMRALMQVMAASASRPNQLAMYGGQTFPSVGGAGDMMAQLNALALGR